jgi:hypothetical protein
MTRARLPAVEAVGELIRTRDELIQTDDGRTTRIHGPCLLALLITHLHASTRGNGAGGKGAGTMPLNTQAWDLLVEIRHNTYSWADLLGVDATRYAAEDTPRAGKPTTPPIGKLLRAVAAVASTTARDEVANAITRCAHRWAKQIEEIVDQQRERRGIRGGACPNCAATEVTEERDDVDRWPPRDGCRTDGKGTFRTPALVLVAPGLDEPEATLVCNACGWHAPVSAAAIHLGDQAAVVVHTTATRPTGSPVDDQAGQAA